MLQGSKVCIYKVPEDIEKSVMRMKKSPTGCKRTSKTCIRAQEEAEEHRKIQMSWRNRKNPEGYKRAQEGPKIHGRKQTGSR